MTLGKEASRQDRAQPSATWRADRARTIPFPRPRAPTTRKVRLLGSGATEHPSDAGILPPGKEARRLNLQCASDDWVNCENGMSGSQTCQDACNGLCCRGDKACEQFTGEICKDDVTCVGYKACYETNITTVAGGCNGGGACATASITTLNGGCSGSGACSFASITTFDGGCNGDGACHTASITTVDGGCNGDSACSWASITTVDGGCNGTVACTGASIGTVAGGCNGTSACNGAGYHGHLDKIDHACHGYMACHWMAMNGSISDVVHSCNAEKACRQAGAYGGIGGILNSCNRNKSCYRAGSISQVPDPWGYEDFLGNGHIDSVMTNCCNNKGECEKGTEDDLPSVCSATSTSTTKPAASCENLIDFRIRIGRKAFAVAKHKTCSWVSNKPLKRCARRGSGKILANKACPGACDPACSPKPCTGGDDGEWLFVPRRHSGRANLKRRDCAWVAKSSHRCDKKGVDGTKASQACCTACA